MLFKTKTIKQNVKENRSS